MFRIGFGSDIHRLVPDRPLMIGGVLVASDIGAEGHSDADVLLHAITDAVLGALAIGDIGSHFSPSDDRWRDAESSAFLRFAVAEMEQRGYRVANLDSTVHLESPKLRPYIDEIRSAIAAMLAIEVDRVSVKAKTGEGVDAVGERRAIRAEAAVCLEFRQV